MFETRSSLFRALDEVRGDWFVFMLISDVARSYTRAVAAKAISYTVNIEKRITQNNRATVMHVFRKFAEQDHCD